MTHPEVVRCFDGHYRRVIYSIGPYIADYPEQALVASIVQGWCPRYALFLFIVYLRSHVSHSCTADRRDLGEAGGRRSQEHRDTLVEEFALGALWEEYGLVGNVVVSVT